MNQAEQDRRHTLRYVLSPSLVTALDELWDHHRDVEERRAAARERALTHMRGSIPHVEVVAARREDLDRVDANA